MITFTVEQATGPNGATAEVATMHHEGRSFTALGSIVDEAAGYLVGYVYNRDGRLFLGTFEGAELCPLKLTATYERWSLYHQRTVMRCYRATYNGRVYTGRHGDIDLLRMHTRKAG